MFHFNHKALLFANKQVTGTEEVEPTRVRLGPHARRRANKRVVVVQESNDKVEAEVPSASVTEA